MRLLIRYNMQRVFAFVNLYLNQRVKKQCQPNNEEQNDRDVQFGFLFYKRPWIGTPAQVNRDGVFSWQKLVCKLGHDTEHESRQVDENTPKIILKYCWILQNKNVQMSDEDNSNLQVDPLRYDHTLDELNGVAISGFKGSKSEEQDFKRMAQQIVSNSMPATTRNKLEKK